MMEIGESENCGVIQLLQ